MRTFSSSTDALDEPGDEEESTDPLATFGGRVVHARRLNGLSQRRAAKRLGCAAKTIWSWENTNPRHPDLELVYQFCRLTDVSVGWLYEGGRFEEFNWRVDEQRHEIYEREHGR